MPHDANGNVLNVGDKVNIPGTITQINASEDYCNCNVKLDHSMPPDKSETNISAINTNQVEKK